MVVQSLKDDICGRGTYDTQDEEEEECNAIADKNIINDLKI